MAKQYDLGYGITINEVLTSQYDLGYGITMNDTAVSSGTATGSLAATLATITDSTGVAVIITGQLV